MVKKSFTITADTGVHARPAALLVDKASQYKSELELKYKEKIVNLKSIIGVMSLGIPKGATVKVRAEGEDEQKAIEGVQAVMEEYLV